MSAWELPVSLNVGGHNWKIRTDFRAILDILKYFDDPEYEPDERWLICLDILYEDFDNMPQNLWDEAAEKAIDFIDMGIKDDGKRKPHTVDWEFDAPVILPAINKVLGTEVRATPYMHWWTFLGAYMEIGESLFSQIVGIREKKAKHKKLEKYEQEFYNANRKLVDIPKHYTEEEREQLKNLEKWL